MKKLLALLLAAMMLLGCVSALADEGSEPDWTGYDARIAEIKKTTDFAAREKLLHSSGVSSWILRTSASFPTCFSICSRISSSPLATIVIRVKRGSAVTPAVIDSILYPRLANNPEMRLSTPELL